MPTYYLYKDFLRFLDALEEEDPWDAYSKYYYYPHKAFLQSYWRTFRWMDLEQIRARVEKVKKGDYSTLQSLLRSIDLEDAVKSILTKCAHVIEAPQEPEIYFIVGFFSADGFVFEHQGKPVIGFGLERFEDWRLLPVLFAHEYAHFLKHLYRCDEPYLWEGSDTLKRFLLSEGLAISFSKMVFPEYPLRDHLFFPEERLSWCRQNTSRIWAFVHQVLKGKRDTAVLWRGDAALGIPPRIGSFIAYCLMKACVEQRPELDYPSLFKFRNITDVIDESTLLTLNVEGPCLSPTEPPSKSS